MVPHQVQLGSAERLGVFPALRWEDGLDDAEDSAAAKVDHLAEVGLNHLTEMLGGAPGCAANQDRTIRPQPDLLENGSPVGEDVLQCVVHAKEAAVSVVVLAEGAAELAHVPVALRVVEVEDALAIAAAKGLV